MDEIAERALIKVAMWPVLVVVGLILGEDGSELSLAEDQQPIQDWQRTELTRRSAHAFARGARRGLRSTAIPATATMASKLAVNLASRSRIR